MIMPFFYRAAIPWYYRHYQRFMAGTRRSADRQRRILFEKLQRNAGSDFGRAHGFGRIHTVADFRNQVPVADYEYYRAWIEQVKAGNERAMFAPGTKILMFAMTSGTTASSKYIPVTEEFFAEYRRSWLTWGGRAYGQHTDQAWKKTVQLSSNWQQFRTESGVPCGSISGLAAELAPRYTRSAFVVPSAVIRIRDASAKHYAALRIAMATPRVGMLITANPSTLVEFARRGDDCRELLIRDIYDGQLSGDLDISGQIRKELAGLTRRRNPKRARELEAIIQRTGKLYPRDYWPQLSLLAVWMGGSAGVYLRQLDDYFGRQTLRDHGLSASEGRMTIPVDDETSAGILDYAGHYFEFIPEGEINARAPIVLESHELEPGQNYYILLTTSSGLYRYDIHDVVRCEGFEGQAPILRFLNKGHNFSSITGEKLSEHHVVAAARKCFEENGRPVGSFTVAPTMVEGRPRYVLLLEQTTQARETSQLALQMEEALRRVNIEYAEKSESGRLHPLAIIELPQGTWQAYRNMKTAERGNFEEFKHPCLVNDLNFVELIQALPEGPVSKKSEN